MTHPLEGATRIINVNVASSGAGATSLNLRPAAGCVWEVLIAQGFQDDGVVTHGWYMTDPDTAGGNIVERTAGGAYEALGVGCFESGTDRADHLLGPIILTYDRYLTYKFTASAAAKNSYIRAIVREYRGVAVEA